MEYPKHIVKSINIFRKEWLLYFIDYDDDGYIIMVAHISIILLVVVGIWLTLHKFPEWWSCQKKKVFTYIYVIYVSSYFLFVLLWFYTFFFALFVTKIAKINKEEKRFSQQIVFPRKVLLLLNIWAHDIAILLYLCYKCMYIFVFYIREEITPIGFVYQKKSVIYNKTWFVV